MKKLFTLLTLLLVLAISASAALPSVRIGVTTNLTNTTGTLLIDVLTSSGAAYSPVRQASLSSQTTDEGGLLSVVLDGTTRVSTSPNVYWTGLAYQKDDLVRVTFNGVVLSIERMEVVLAKQSLYGALINPNEMDPVGEFHFAKVTAGSGATLVELPSTSGGIEAFELVMKDQTVGADLLNEKITLKAPTDIADGASYNLIYPPVAPGDNQVLQTNGTSGQFEWVTPILSVNGTTNRITVGGPATAPVIDIASTYVGQSSITTVGTLGTLTVSGTTALNGTIRGATPLVFDGGTLGGNTMTFAVPDPATTSKTITFPDVQGTVLLDATVNGFAWRLLGNSGTTPGTNFIGTTDAQRLIFKVNGQNSGEINHATPFTTSFGYQALMSATGTLNTAFGYKALTANTTGTYNTAVGYQALQTNIDGEANSAFGINALGLNTSSFNSAFGGGALNANTTGTKNTATGYQALTSLTGSNPALNSNNSAYGNQAFYNLTSGSNNIAIGNQAGITTGSAPVTNTENSIYLGANAKASAVTGNTNEIVIGYDATGNGSNSVTLGNTSITKTYLRGAVTATTYNGFTLPAVDAGASNNILVSTGANRTLSWSTLATTMADLTQGTGITTFTYDGSSPASVAINTGASLSWSVAQTFTDVAVNGTVSGTNNLVLDSELGSLTITGGTINGAVIGGSTPAAGTFTDLSVKGNTTLGDGTGTDVVTFTSPVRTAGSIIPSVTATDNLGGSSNRFATVYATTFDGALTGNAATATKVNNALSQGTGITTFSYDGSATKTVAIDLTSSLTWSAAQTFSAGITDAAPADWSITAAGVATFTSIVSPSTTITGGTINGAIIGGSTPAAGTFTDLSVKGNTTLGDGTGTDVVTFTSGVHTAGSIIPSVTGTDNLGTSGLRFGTVYATTFDGALNGNATSATSTAITDDVATGSAVYPTWVTTTTGNLPQKVSSSKLSFIPSTGVLTAIGFAGPLVGNVTGNLSGNASTATSATSATTATNLALGGAGSVPYQSAAGTTTFLGVGSPTQIMQLNGTPIPTWVTVSGDATIATGGALTLKNTGTAGTYGSASSVPTITTDAQGRVTVVTTNTVIAPAGTLTGATLAANVLASSLTSVGTLGNLTVTNTISGSVTGNAASATTTAITNDNATNATYYPTWVTSNSGNLAQNVSSTKLTFNPSTGMLTATGFTGPLTGTASNAAKVTNALTKGNGIAYSSGTTYDGSAGITASIDNAYTNTWSVIQYFTNGLAQASSTPTWSITGAGAASFGSTLGVTGITTLTGALNANGGINADAGLFTVGDGTGNIYTSGTLGVNGASTLTGLVTANGGITADAGVFTVADGTGNIHTSGTLDATGATTLGNTVDITGVTTHHANVVPGASQNGTLNLGIADNQMWNNLYLDGVIQNDGLAVYVNPSWTKTGAVTVNDKLVVNDAFDLAGLGTIRSGLVDENEAESTPRNTTWPDWEITDDGKIYGYEIYEKQQYPASTIYRVATLSTDGKLRPEQVPTALTGAVNYIGTWDPRTETAGTPPLPAADILNKGWYYVISEDQATSVTRQGLASTWNKGDWIISTGLAWQRVANGAGFANTALNNLSSVAINASLLPRIAPGIQHNMEIDLGSMEPTAGHPDAPVGGENATTETYLWRHLWMWGSAHIGKNAEIGGFATIAQRAEIGTNLRVSGYSKFFGSISDSVNPSGGADYEKWSITNAGLGTFSGGIQDGPNSLSDTKVAWSIDNTGHAEFKGNLTVLAGETANETVTLGNDGGTDGVGVSDDVVTIVGDFAINNGTSNTFTVDGYDGSTYIAGSTSLNGAVNIGNGDGDNIVVSTTNWGVTAAGAATFGSTLGVTGTTSLNGAINLGDATGTDLITFSTPSRTVGSIIPNVTNTNDLGASGAVWANVHATTFTGALSGNATTATTLQTTRAIYGNNFNGSAALTQIIASTYGGTGNGFTKFSGPAASEKTFALPDASATILTTNAVVTSQQGGTGVNNGGSTITLAGNLITSGANSLTLTTAGATIVTLPTTGTLVNNAVTTLSSLASVGTITTGAWNGTIVSPTYGGTGTNNGTNTLTIGASASVSGTNTGDIQEVSDQYSATASQVTFTLTNTPSSKCVVKLYINGVRISNAAITFSGTTATYDYTKNSGSSPLVAGDRIQIDYFYTAP